MICCRSCFSRFCILTYSLWGLFLGLAIRLRIIRLWLALNWRTIVVIIRISIILFATVAILGAWLIIIQFLFLFFPIFLGRQWFIFSVNYYLYYLILLSLLFWIIPFIRDTFLDNFLVNLFQISTRYHNRVKDFLNLFLVFSSRSIRPALTRIIFHILFGDISIFIVFTLINHFFNAWVLWKRL